MRSQGWATECDCRQSGEFKLLYEFVSVELKNFLISELLNNQASILKLLVNFQKAISKQFTYENIKLFQNE